MRKACEAGGRGTAYAAWRRCDSNASDLEDADEAVSGGDGGTVAAATADPNMGVIADDAPVGIKGATVALLATVGFGLGFRVSVTSSSGLR